MNKTRLNILLILTILAFPLTQGLLSPFLNTISETYSLNYQQTGLIFTFFYFGFILSTLTIGFVSDKWGIRVIIWGILLCSTASFLIFANRSYLFFIAAVIILGISLGVVDIMSASSLALINTQKKGFYINIMQFTGCMGGIVVPLIGGIMVQEKISWKFGFLASSIMLFLLFILLFREPFPMKETQSDINFRILASLMKDRRVIILCLTFLCIFSIEGSLLGWLGVYMTKIHGVSDFLSGLSISLIFLAIGLSRLIIAFFSDRVKHVNLVLSSSIAGCCLFVAALLSPNFPLALVFFFFSMFASAGIFTTIVVMANSLYPQYAGAMLSLTFSVGTVGAIIVPGLIGTIAQAFQLKAGLSILVVLFIVIAVMFAYLKFSHQRMEPMKIDSATYPEVAQMP